MALPPLVAELIARTDGFQAGLARAAQSAQKSAGDISGAMEKIKAGLGVLGVGASVAGLSALLQQTTAIGDELYKMSQRVGVSVENLSTLRYAADLSGVALADLDGLLVKLNKKLGEAGAGSESAGKFLQQFGIDVADVRNGTVTTDEALKRIADRFAATPDGINKSAAAVELFGKAGAAIIPFLNQGRDAIEGLQTEATKLGLKISTETAQRMEAFNDQLRTLTFSSEGAKVAIVSSILPAIEGITKAMRDATVEGGKFAGLVAGLATFLTGDEQYKNDEKMVELVGKQIEMENRLARAKDAGIPSRIRMAQEALDQVNAEIKTTQAYRVELEKFAAAEKAAAEIRAKAKAGGGQLELPEAGPARVKAAKDMTAEYERLARLVQEAEEQAAADTTGAWSAVAEQRNKELEQLRKDQEAMWKQIYAEIDAEQERAIEQGKAYLDSLKVETKDAEKFARDLGLTFSSAFEDAVVEGRRLQDVLDGLARDLLRIVVRKSVTEPLGQSITDMLKGSSSVQQLAGPSDGGGFFDGVLKFLGFRAGGGPVTAGGAYVVGERGPELFVPNAAGTVVPNGAMGAVEVNVINNGPPVSARASAPRFDGKRMVVDVVLDALRTDAGFREGLRANLAAPR